MKEFSFSIPQDIVVGRGSLEKLGMYAEKLGGTHALIISGPSLYRHGLVERAIKALVRVDIAADYYIEVEANPSVATVENATAAFQKAGADFIIALGGGSPMDVAKAVAIVAKYGGSIVDYEGGGKVPGKVIPMIAVPTTAGTGSEVTAFSVITDHARDYKLTVFSYELLPAVAILDPELIMTTPAHVAAACGIDAFIHAEEAYISLAASPFTEAMSEKAMELIGSSIRRFVADREAEEAAEKMLIGSLFAGISFSFARLGNVHAMSHPISAYFDVPHGVANAVVLPAVLQFNASADSGKYYKIYNTIAGIPCSAEEFEPDMLVAAIRQLLLEIGIPDGILEAVRGVCGKDKVTREDIERVIPAMVEDAMKSGNIVVNPRCTTAEDIRALYACSI